MPTAIKIWEIVKDSLQPVTDDSFAKGYLEKELEALVEKDASLLGDRVLIIGRQQKIPGVGILDLLGIDQNGTLVVIELKRDHTPREAVAQALDYASWLHSADEEEISAWAVQYLKQPLEKKFSEFFDLDEEGFPGISCQKPRIVLVAPRLDAPAERIIAYLSEQYRLDINAVFFQYARLQDGKEVLARAVLVDEESAPPKSSRREPTADELLKAADEHGTRILVDICRDMGNVWTEESKPTFGGSFRYWGQSEAGQYRMVFGVNVSGKAEPPHGQLDVWIPAPSVAEVIGRSESDVRAALATHPIVSIHMGRNEPCWVRLTTPEEAQALVQQLREFAQEAPRLKA